MKRYLFNDGWTFYDGSINALSAQMGVETDNFPVNLPHDCVIGTDRVDDQSLTSVAFYQSRNVAYTKELDLPEGPGDQNYWLEFEGVYQQGYLYVNNAYAGQCKYGYGNYYHDITMFLRPGKNEIKMVVKNGVASGRWYTGGGIYRDVNLYMGPRLHIRCEGTRVSTEDLEADQAVLRVVTPLEYTDCTLTDVVVVNEVFDPRGELAAREETPVTVFPGEHRELRQRLYVENPELWDEFTPNLYTVCTRLVRNGQVIDSFTDTFGIRKLQLDPRHGLRVNGRTVKLRGGCIHHDNGVVGTASFENSEERRIRILKESGYNAVRMAHHPMSKALLRVCDRLGMYVMDEITDVWNATKAEFDYGMNFAQWWERDTENMVWKDYNHPCVILYSIGNEIPEMSSPIDGRWGKKLADKIRSLDDTRYTLHSSNLMLPVMDHMDKIVEPLGIRMKDSGRNEINSTMTALIAVTSEISCHPEVSALTEEAFGQVDIAGYNYGEDRYELDQTMYPNRIIVGSETFPNHLAKNWALVEKYPNVIGDFGWTAWDYLGEVGIARITYEGENPTFLAEYPWRLAVTGAVDILGHREPVSYWHEIVWGLRSAPFVSVCPPDHYGVKKNPSLWGWSDSRERWDWPGYEGKPIQVEVYSDAEEVELFVNGVSQGRKAPGEEVPFVAKFDTVYEPGEVKAVAYRSGKAEECALVTPGDGLQISLKTEASEIRRKRDLGYVAVQLTDGTGRPVQSREAKLSVQVEGGVLQGFGSADPVSEDNYASGVCTTFEGRALAAVRAFVPGTVRVTVSGEGLEPRSAEFTVR